MSGIEHSMVARPEATAASATGAAVDNLNLLDVVGKGTGLSAAGSEGTGAIKDSASKSAKGGQDIQSGGGGARELSDQANAANKARPADDGSAVIHNSDALKTHSKQYLPDLEIGASKRLEKEHVSLTPSNLQGSSESSDLVKVPTNAPKDPGIEAVPANAPKDPAIVVKPKGS